MNEEKNDKKQIEIQHFRRRDFEIICLQAVDLRWQFIDSPRTRGVMHTYIYSKGLIRFFKLLLKSWVYGMLQVEKKGGRYFVRCG